MLSGSIDGLHYITGLPVRISYSDGLITDVSPLDLPPTGALPFVGPGLTDLQVNGALGVDFTELHKAPNCGASESHAASAAGSIRSSGGVARVCDWLHGFGVTSFLATVITASPERLAASLTILAREVDASPRACAALAGVHLEGPFISALDGYRGAHPAEHCRAPDWDLFLSLQAASGGRIRIVTLAPELPGACAFISRAAAAGVLVSIGHSAASTAEISAAVRAGARLSTHLGNGLPATLPRHANPIWPQLAEDGLTASFIGDGFHLPRELFAVALRAKGVQRCVLVSDAASLAGLPPGPYNTHIGGRVVLEPSGRLRMAEGAYLAGASLPLLRGVEFAARVLAAKRGIAGAEPGAAHSCAPDGGALPRAWALASTQPALLLQRPQAAGLAVGAPADIVTFEYDAPVIACDEGADHDADGDVRVGAAASSVGGDGRLTIVRVVLGGRTVKEHGGSV